MTLGTQRLILRLCKEVQRLLRPAPFHAGADHEDLHAASETQHQMKSALRLDDVVQKRAAVLERLAGQDQARLSGGNALFPGA